MAATLDGDGLQIGSGVKFGGLKFKPLKLYPSSFTWRDSGSVSGVKYVYQNISAYDPTFTNVNKIVSAMVYDWSGINPCDVNVGGDGGYGLLVSTNLSTWNIGDYISIMIVYI